MESAAKSVPQGGGGQFFSLAVLSLILVGIFFGISNAVDVAEVSRNWPKYRCSPQVMPFASLYGYNTAENFNYCLKSIFQGQLGGTTAPFMNILGSMTKTLMTFLANLNSLRVMISTLVGGIGKMMQEFTDRFKLLFSQVKFSFLKLQILMRRVYGMFFAIIYMGMSGIQIGQNFSQTVIFKFMDTFCFAPETILQVRDFGSLAISDIRLGDVLLPTGTRVISIYRFAADGQSMVDIHGIQVSTNHFIRYNNTWISSRDYPDAIPIGDWKGGYSRPLVCLDTDTHTIPIGSSTFSDWDETSEIDGEYMLKNEQILNGHFYIDPKPYPWIFQPAIHPKVRIMLANGNTIEAENIELGTHLSTGIVKGIGRKYVKDICTTKEGSCITASTLLWDNGYWKRAGHIYPVVNHKKEQVYCTLVILGTASIELATGEYLRDMVEVHSPDTDSPIQAILQHVKPDNA